MNSKAVFFGSAINGLFKYENGKFISYLFNGQFLEKKIKMVLFIVLHMKNLKMI